MEIDLKMNIEVFLKMTKEEALWLKDIMQNPLNFGEDFEDQEDLEMRTSLFGALSTCADLNLMEE